MSLQTNITNLATRIATECKSIRTLINGNTGDLSTLTTAAKTSLVAAINELQSEITAAAGGGAVINDAATDTSAAWSASKIITELQTVKDDLLGGAGAAFDTLQELATLIQENDGDIGTILTDLANRVRFDAAQTLTAPQQLQARSNIGAASSADVGDTTANFVTTFEAGLA